MSVSSPDSASTDSAIPVMRHPFAPWKVHDVYGLRHPPLWGIKQKSGPPKGSAVKQTLLLAAIVSALAFAAPASSATLSTWTAKDMRSAARALHYPKAGMRKLGCRGKTTFRCVATYRHHRRRVFYAQWQSMGGWLCAGAKASTCKLLRHGFIPTAQASGGLPGAAQFASRGYMDIHYNDPQPYAQVPCAQAGQPSTWTFCYKLDVGSVSVNITLKRVKTGYATTASETRSG